MASGRNDSGRSSEFQGEKELLNLLAEKEPPFAEIEHLLARLRTICQDDIFRSFASENWTQAEKIEGRLWDIHVKINGRFRKPLSRFRDDDGKKRPVEKRKLEKHYLNFIKSSQRFYRGYIQHILTVFDGIPELEQVAKAKEFGYESRSADPKHEATGELRSVVLRSCHSTLIRLGDLSRYREMELVPPSKDRNWDKAIFFYDLAGSLRPDSGVSHNQLAIIGLVDGNHLRATYHLYRALSAKEPYPNSNGNLEIEFRKILAAWSKGELLAKSKDTNASLISLFIYLHAQCYKGVDFPEHDELENEILSQIAVNLKEQSLEPALLEKFCLISIAAEAYAQHRLKDGNEGASNAQYFFQRLNVKTFFTLLQILLAELECSVASDSEKITAVTKCVLPVLRHYSSWLLSNSSFLIAETKDTALYVQIKEFWKIYAGTLSLLTSTFDVASLPVVEYLLKEDGDILGFAPLINSATTRRYRDESDQKPRPSQMDKRATVNDEMLFRIREFVTDGLELVVHEKIPIALVNDKDAKMFVYKEEGLPEFSSPSCHNHNLSSTSIEHEDIQRHGVSQGPTEDGASQSASASVSAAMNRMVDSLVESETHENPPVEKSFSATTAWGNTGLGVTVADQGYNNAEHYSTVPSGSPYTPTTALAPTQSYSPRPTLPSIMNTAFAPKPGEAFGSASRPSTARQNENQGLSTITNNATPASNSSSYFPFGSSLKTPTQFPSINLTPNANTWMNDSTISYGPVINGGQFNSLGYYEKENMSPYVSSPYSCTPSGSGNSAPPAAGIIGQTPPSGQGG